MVKWSERLREIREHMDKLDRDLEKYVAQVPHVEVRAREEAAVLRAKLKKDYEDVLHHRIDDCEPNA